MNSFTEKLYNFFTSFHIFKYLFITILIFSTGCSLFEESEKLLSIEISPASATIPKGKSVVYTAIAKYSDGRTSEITDSADWTISDKNVSFLSLERDKHVKLKGNSIGKTSIEAKMDSISGYAELTVTTPELVSIAITPVSGSIAKGLTLQYTAIGTYTDNSTKNITGTVTWSSTNSGFASINGSGLASALSVGAAKITARSGEISDSTGITVTEPLLTSIDINPLNESIASGLSLQYTATGNYSDGSSMDITMLATWSSTSPGVAAISNIFGTNGLATAQAIGTTIIEAEIDGISHSTNLTVTEAELETIIVTPANDSIADGLTLQYTATGTYTDGSTQDITTSVTWSSSNNGVATVSSSGLATGQTTGSITIAATLAGISGSGTLTVSAPAVVSISITPVNDTMEAGSNLQYIAMAKYSNSSTGDITNSVTWSSTITAVATISNSSGFKGLAAGVAAGTTKITAALGEVSDSTGLTVTPSIWWELQVTTTSSSQNMTIQMDGPVNLTVDWGDGIVDTTSQTSFTHTYASAGVYTMKIRGQASRIRFNNPDAQARLTRILSVVQGIDGLTSFWDTFFECTGLTGSIPPGLFDNTPLVTSFMGTFYGCRNLTGPIPAGLFDNNPLVTDFNATFRFTGLTGPIPAGLFDNNTLVTSFWDTFRGCTGLTGSIPSGLFDNNTQVTTFENTFFECRGLTAIPSGLFDNNTLVTNFYGTFWRCSGLTSIPSGLFKNNTLATNFESTFYDATGLTAIPAGLFDNNPLVTTFRGTFNGCTGLTSIPSGLFNNTKLVTDFAITFLGCTGLTSIPYGLFKNTPLVTDFEWTFANATGITSEVPALWISHFGALHTRCFGGVTSASNYEAIPVDWK